MAAAISHADTDVVVIGLPNHLHEEAARMLAMVEEAGIFAGYLEDLVYTPKGLKAAASIANGAIGEVTSVRSRETHPGPHSSWFWDMEMAGGGAIVDLGCHCIEIIRTYVGKGNRPLEVVCWTDTLVHPIDAEDNATAMIRFESGALGQFDVSWTFRGGMDLRDEVAGTEGSIWLNHFLRTGMEMFTTGAGEGYLVEKAETGTAPAETFYDGYVVNAVVDACYRSAESKQWEPVDLDWRGGSTARISPARETEDGLIVIKEETFPDGRRKMILRDPETGVLSERTI
jgi:predicted dehydrogenase